MYKIFSLPLLLFGVTLAAAQTGGPASALSEQDFLGDMPIVLSVSRLAQRLDETPGAMTILDRNFIRMTGARDVVDLLRLVPGFQTTTSFETDAPMATYHGRSDEVANRIQVLVDGRSVYSGFLLGSAGLGWQTLALDDIERIEVLRGSNSAAYGARAFLGVVNIVSRDVRETHGTSVTMKAGENGIADLGARLGWGDSPATYRISADTRGDDGLRKVFANGAQASGRNRTSRVNFASHLSSDGQGEVEVHAGAVEIAAVRGDTASVGNLERLRFLGSQFLQMDWQKTLSDDQDIAFSASHTENTNNDSFPYFDPDPAFAAYFGIPIEFKARELNDVISLQHTVRQSTAVSTVWGGEVRREQIISRSSFDTKEQVSSNFYRLFASMQWRMSENAVLNLGALDEFSDIGGSSFSPRIMLNWQFATGHTLRIGASSAFRPPTAYEKYAAVRYYDTHGANPTALYVSGNVGLVPEKIITQEMGYYFNPPGANVAGDVRLFSERIVDGIGVKLKPNPIEYGNGDSVTIAGAEYQLSWKPATTTQFFFNQTWTNIQVHSMAFPDVDTLRKTVHGAPKYAASLTVMHSLPNGGSLTLMHQRAEEFALTSDSGNLFSMERTDVRLAKAFKLGATRAELALTVQNLDVPYRDGDKKFYFDRRAMLSLRFEN